MATASQLAFIVWAGVVFAAWAVADLVVLADLKRSWSRAERVASVLVITAAGVGITAAGELVGADLAVFLIAAFGFAFVLVGRRGYLYPDRVESRRDRIMSLAMTGALGAAYYGGKYLIAPHR